MGELIAYDGNTPIYAPYDGVIVFPYIPKWVWEEVCVFGRRQNNDSFELYK